MAKLKVGSVHGRFQPFHNGHLDYVLQAFDRADFVYVGLTQIFRPLSDDAASRRDTWTSNPLGYFDRMSLIVAALTEFGVPRHRFTVIPFPIEMPEKLPDFCPLDIPCFTTIVDDWNREKIQRLEGVGYKVELLEVSPVDNNRVTSGSEVRKMIRSDDATWKRYVPPSVVESLSAGIIQRIKYQTATSSGLPDEATPPPSSTPQ